jgi:hypothetical protein
MRSLIRDLGCFKSKPVGPKITVVQVPYTYGAEHDDSKEAALDIVKARILQYLCCASDSPYDVQLRPFSTGVSSRILELVARAAGGEIDHQGQVPLLGVQRALSIVTQHSQRLARYCCHPSVNWVMKQNDDDLPCSGW